MRAPFLARKLHKWIALIIGVQVLFWDHTRLDQGDTPNTMFAIAEYPNGQYVMFNVRNFKKCSDASLLSPNLPALALNGTFLPRR